MTVDSVASLRDPARVITRTVYGNAPSGCDVIVYEIDGGKHSWADKDLPTSKILWEFFSRYLKK